MTRALDTTLLPPPVWAAEWGEDVHNVVASFVVGDVMHRMRWIPPGVFLMGSPVDEPGRYDDEGPRHRVILTSGYWLGETPVTQALWEAVMGENPSHFKGATRPVERVSWEDCIVFCERLSTQVPGLFPRLPTEAEWERACRAGTEGMTWVGALTLRDDIIAPELDALAWYGANSGRETHPVGEKAANPYGLHDMLGNVWEWCHDLDGTYGKLPVSDSARLDIGRHRAFRGGAWGLPAKACRASCRSADWSVYRKYDIGFRLAAGHVETAYRSDGQTAQFQENVRQQAHPQPVGTGVVAMSEARPTSRDASEVTVNDAQVAQRMNNLAHHDGAPESTETLARDWRQPRPLSKDGKPRSRRESAPTALKELDADVRLGLEQVIGLDDTLPTAFLVRAARVARAVGRIGRPQSAGGLRPDGTGFLVSNALLVTNEHVLPDRTAASRRVVEFDNEEDEDGNARLGQSFKLDPSRLFLVSKELDVAIVAVAPTNEVGATLEGYGAIRLRDQSDAIAVGVGVVLIQHPRGERKRIALRENEIDYLDDTWVHYQADTDPGSSGSPVLDMNLDLIALHHAGVPRIDDQGRVLTTDGAIWDRVDFNRVAWISNEGIRIEKIVAWLQGQRASLSEEARALLDAALQGTVDLSAHVAEPRPPRLGG